MNGKIEQMLSKIVVGEKNAYQIFKQSQKQGEIICMHLDMLNFFATQEHLRNCDPEALFTISSWFTAVSGDKRPFKYIDLVLDAFQHQNWGGYASMIVFHTMLGFKETYDPENNYLKKILEEALLNTEHNPWAQFTLAVMYSGGVGVQTNVTLAKEYYSKLMNYPCGTFHSRYAKLLLSEVNTEKPCEKLVNLIFSLLESSKQLNNPNAFLLEANIYTKGGIVTKDLKRAEDLVLETIKLGHSGGYLALAVLLQNQPQIDQNKVMDCEDRALAGGIREGLNQKIERSTFEKLGYVKTFLHQQNNFSSLLNVLNTETYQLSKIAQTLLLEIFSGKGDYENFKLLQLKYEIVCTHNDMLMLAIEQSDLSLCIPEVFYDLTICYLFLNNMVRPKEYEYLVLDAAKKGNPGAKIAVILLAQDSQCQISPDTIKKIYADCLSGVLKEDVFALLTLGFIYQYNFFNTIESKTSIPLFMKAASLGSSIAQFSIAEIYQSKNDVSSLKNAFVFVQKAVAQLLPAAFNLLGTAFLKGWMKLDLKLAYKAYQLGSLLGSPISMASAYTITCALNDISPEIASACFNLTVKLNPNLQTVHREIFHMEVTTTQKNNDFKVSNLHSIIQDHLQEILQGKEGSYKNFKECKLQRKFVFTLTEQLYYFCSQPSLVSLDYEAFFECAKVYTEMDEELKPVQFKQLTFDAACNNNLGACFALAFLEGKGQLVIHESLREKIYQFLVGIIYHNTKDVSWALAALGLIKTNEQKDNIDEKNKSLISDYFDRAIALLNPAVILLFASTLNNAWGNTLKSIRYLKLNCMKTSPFAAYCLGMIHSTQNQNCYNLNIAFKHFEEAALLGDPLGMAAFGLLCKKIIRDKNDKRSSYYLVKARQHGAQYAIPQIEEHLLYNDSKNQRINLETRCNSTIQAVKELLSLLQDNKLLLSSVLASEFANDAFKISTPVWSKITYSIRHSEYLAELSIDGFVKDVELDYKNLIGSLNKLKQLDTLILRNVKISIYHFEKLLLFAKKANLRNLVIDKIKFQKSNDSQMHQIIQDKITEFFSKFSLESFQLSMDNEQISYFIAGLEKFDIKSISFINCALTSYDLDDLLHVVVNPSITSLSLTDDNASIYDEDFNKLIATVKTNKNIKELNLTGLCSVGNELYQDRSDRFRKSIVELITENELISLNLSDNNLQDEDIRVIAEGISCNPILLEVRLGANEIGDQGIAFLSDALRVNTTITTLNLELSNFGDVGLQILFSALMSNPENKLQSLDISEPAYTKKITSKAMEYLIQYLQHPNCKLIALDLFNWGEDLLDDDFKSFFKALENNSQLSFINLSGNPITNECKASILNLIKGNPRIKNIILENTKLTEDAILEINKAILEPEKSTIKKVSKNLKNNSEETSPKKRNKNDFLNYLQNSNLPLKVTECEGKLRLVFESKENLLSCLDLLKDKLGAHRIKYSENELCVLIEDFLDYKKKDALSLVYLMKKKLWHNDKEANISYANHDLGESKQVQEMPIIPCIDRDDVVDVPKLVRKKEKADKFEQVNLARIRRKETKEQEKKLKQTKKKINVAKFFGSNKYSVVTNGNVVTDFSIKESKEEEIKENVSQVEIIINNPNFEVPFTIATGQNTRDILLKLAIDNGHYMLGMFDAVKAKDYDYSSPVMVYEGLYCAIRMLQALALENRVNLEKIITQSDARNFRNILIDRCDFFLLDFDNNGLELSLLFSEKSESLFAILCQKLLPQIEKIYENKHFNQELILLHNHVLFKAFCLNSMNLSQPNLSIPKEFINDPATCFKMINIQVQRINSFMSGIKNNREVNTQVHEINAIKMAVVFVGHLARILRDYHQGFCSTNLIRLKKYSDNVYNFVKSNGRFYQFLQDISLPKKTPLLSQLKMLSSNSKSLKIQIDELLCQMSLADTLMLFIEIRNTVGHDYSGAENVLIECVYDEISGHLIYDIVYSWLNKAQQQFKDFENKVSQAKSSSFLIKNSVLKNNSYNKKEVECCLDRINNAFAKLSNLLDSSKYSYQENLNLLVKIGKIALKLREENYFYCKTVLNSSLTSLCYRSELHQFLVQQDNYTNFLEEYKRPKNTALLNQLRNFSSTKLSSFVKAISLTDFLIFAIEIFNYDQFIATNKQEKPEFILEISRLLLQEDRLFLEFQKLKNELKHNMMNLDAEVLQNKKSL